MTKENRNRLIAGGVTVVVHVIAVVLLCTFALSTPLPLPGESGVEVEFGYDEQSSYQEQRPQEPEQIVEQPIEQPKPEATPEPEIVEEQTVTQDTEETPAIEPVKPKEETPVIDPRTLFHNTEHQDQNVSEGDDEEGDSGQANGDPNAENPVGPGGDGVNTDYDLGGREPLGSLPKPKREELTQKGDKICIQIKVNSSGEVVEAVYRSKGSTLPQISENQPAIDAAIEAAKKSRWQMKKDDTGILIGTITYIIL